MNVPQWLKSFEGELDLNQEVQLFIKFIEPNKNEYKIREELLTKYSKILEKEGYNIMPFGSTQSKLFLPTSDIDFSVITNEYNTRKVLNSISSILSSYVLEDQKRNFKASVPVLKLTDKQTLIVLDISHNNTSGTKTVDFIEEIIKKDDRIRRLVLLIKSILCCYDFHQPANGGLGTYSVFVMVYCYVNNNNITTHDYGELLKGFLKYYGIDFRSDIEGLSVFEGKFNRGERNWDSKISNLSIEDPCDLSNDVSITSFRWQYIKYLFKMSYNALHYTHLKTYDSEHSLLKRIICLPDVFFERRKLWEQLINQNKSVVIHIDVDSFQPTNELLQHIEQQPESCLASSIQKSKEEIQTITTNKKEETNQNINTKDQYKNEKINEQTKMDEVIFHEEIKQKEEM
ncbi:PAP-associated domain-containing protein, putative [Entamoeba dispar SAW760]|uniref:PAP-associated domain-containing protein, putative n=1 Tax=Entamoeba dispar (strain ATCC PRA-260 / SAW760) TaxID=370354 RepID=B0EF40_ENTDS|nr:PAP-associated domain-containing protein, putative [Entamoeba dispar SAW760]EDR26889.1 PAP-associated domain-containing protein, putative [Entamoeba dispar SAW760]|eukprot:EDR26889.1 PAP-associated domain-containing protein, putative [Entamoeba dispar SAW760]